MRSFRLAVVVAVVFSVPEGSEGSGFGPIGVPEDAEEDAEAEEAGDDDAGADDAGAEDVEPEDPASVVMVRNSLLHQPVFPSGVCTFAHPALELSTTVSFVPWGIVTRAV